MTAGFGTGEWGLDGWGGLDPNLHVVHAYAISTHEIVVELSKPPLDRTPFLVGDARNIGSWEVSIPATSELLPVAHVSAFQRPLQWIVRTQQQLPNSLVIVRVRGTSLKDAALGIIGTPDFADLAGVTELDTSTPDKVTAKRLGARDLQNLPAPGISDSSVSGTLVIAGGDYSLVDGAELLKKLITRRLLTTPGEFFHLPTYGVGLRVKEPLSGGDLVTLKATIERQLLEEPDLAVVKVSISQRAEVLTCTVLATLARTGQQVSIPVALRVGGS